MEADKTKTAGGPDLQMTDANVWVKRLLTQEVMLLLQCGKAQNKVPM